MNPKNGVLLLPIIYLGTEVLRRNLLHQCESSFMRAMEVFLEAFKEKKFEKNEQVQKWKKQERMGRNNASLPCFLDKSSIGLRIQHASLSQFESSARHFIVLFPVLFKVPNPI